MAKFRWLIAFVLLLATSGCQASEAKQVQRARDAGWIDAGGDLEYKDVGTVRCFHYVNALNLSCVVVR